MKRLQQLFTYSGSKFLLANTFASYFPKHRRFVSLFGGSAGEFAAKEPSAVEVYNDLDDHLYAVWQVLQNPKQYEQLIELLENTPNGRKQYELCRNILDDSLRKHSRLRRAWAFLVCGSICRGGNHPAIGRYWSTSCNTADTQTRKLLTLRNRIAQWKKRVRRVRIEHADWYDVFKRYDRGDTLTFADPPYHPGTLKSSSKLYRHILTIQMHVKLLRAFSSAKGYVMLCGYNHPLYTAYLFHWRKVEFAAKAYMGNKGNPRREVIWLNYESDGTKIHNNKLLIVKRYLDIMGGITPARRYLDRMIALLALPRPTATEVERRQSWLNYADDGRRLPSTKLLIARRYVEIMGGISAAQRWLERIEKLIDLPK